MTLPVTPEVLAELAGTRPSPAGTATLRAALHARRLLLLKSLLVRVEQHSAALPATARERFEHHWSLLEQAERADPAAVREVLDYPTTGAWLAEAIGAPDGPAFEHRLAHTGAVAVAAAVRAGCRFEAALALPSGVLALPGLGTLRCPSGRVRLSGRAGLVRMAERPGGPGVVLLRARGPAARTVGGGPGWSAVRPLPGGRAVLDDLDPYRVPGRGIGPDALAPAGRQEVSHRLWAQRWREARALLRTTDPDRATEVTALLFALVPLASPGPAGGTTVSATLRSAPGAVLTQFPSDAGDLAESLVHETHHTKLTVLNDLLPLCRQNGGTRHRVGWRPDPRPVLGVLQGAYAHLALTDLWRRARNEPAAPAVWRHRAGGRFEKYREQVGEALSALLGSDELTHAGREFVREMGRRHESLGTPAGNLS
ncbi:aKG-HExxH-type peptide beta-hydroxylase [Streptomyces sp. NPDC006739]|uniref:aKG-HExxH-type peptide beta-hydroxylase n=1 Tax=Streptomyces sp. NPDC006739 TaxID=3364763 RepID=UPI0036754813